MTIYFNPDVYLKKAELEDITDELIKRIKAKRITFEKVISLLEDDENKTDKVVAEMDLREWKIFAGVK